jgi:hypothetical protein
MMREDDEIEDDDVDEIKRAIVRYRNALVWDSSSK